MFTFGAALFAHILGDCIVLCCDLLVHPPGARHGVTVSS